jgi:serine/threonine protein kinase/class 3 adenylate cyclase
MLGRTVGGRYTLEKEIGSGAMGRVWIAIDAQLRRRVALKCMSSEQLVAPNAAARFEREAMAIARLQHPHVVQIYDYGIDEDIPFIVMELLEGEDLDARLRRQGRLPLAAVINLIGQIARALDTAHGAGIIHRDLKPGNVFITRVGSEEVVKILDFGVAMMFAERSAASFSGEDDAISIKSDALIGTPCYMSPEQAMGQPVIDRRADLWALGVVAYRALTGDLPFEAATIPRLLTRIMSEDPEPPSLKVPNLASEADEFFQRAFAKDPDKRFQTARELATALAAVAAADRAVAATKVLVVDDEPNVPLLIRQRFRHQIRKHLYEFFFAGDGEEALEQLRRRPDIDVVLTDINMPRMDGITFLEHIGEVNPVTKTIVISAYGNIPNFRKAMNRGAFDFLVKPIDFKDFEITLEKASKHVRELRRTIQSTEENDVLRMFVGSGILERVVGISGVVGMAPNEEVEATVAFIGVHGFFGDAQSHGADEVVWRLNASLDIIVAEIAANAGNVDRFLNSSVMAVFRGRGHAERALKACVAVRTRVESLALREGTSSPFLYGIIAGVDCGQVIAGNVGSKVLSQLSYTVLGEPVTNALRLAGAAGKNQILVSEAVQLATRGAFDVTPAGDLAERPGTRELGAFYSVVRATPPKALLQCGTAVGTPMSTLSQMTETMEESAVVEHK